MFQSSQSRRGLMVSIFVSLVLILVFSVPFLTAIVEMVGLMGMAVLDAAFGAPLMPRSPWAMYLICGGFVGLCAGLWLIAPASSFKKYRRWMLIAPALVMTALLIVSICRSI